MSADPPAPADHSFLVATFFLGPVGFGIAADQVLEVTRVGEMTPVHDAPEGVVGIRNLRGRIITVLDLTTRLGLGRGAPGRASRILIVDGQGEQLGLLVDEVGDMIEVPRESVAPAPPNVHGLPRLHLRGVVRNEGRLVGLLHLDGLLGMEQEEEATPVLP